MNGARSRKPAGRREDGAATRLQMLEAAGAVFAEKGFGRATGKEIAERAGSNSAAVNYYFGGIEGLYGEVLVEAHRRLLSYEHLLSIAEGKGDPREKLGTLIEEVTRTILGPASETWALRLIAREVLSPSPVFQVLLDQAVLPKKRLLTGIVGEIVGLPAEHPAVSRCCLSLIAPFAVMLVGNRQILAQLLPGLGVAGDAEVVIDHVKRFAFGGLPAIAAGVKD
jgi:AcrR family transcriptional regulator